MAESSSRRRARRNSPPRPTRINPHDRPANLIFEQSDQEARFFLICDKRVQDARPMDWEAIKAIGLKKYVKSLVQPAWRKLLTIQDLQFRELILEFYSTYTYVFVEDATEHCMRFRLAGEWFHLTLFEFAQALDLYDDEEDLDNNLGESFELTEEQRQKFWRRLTGQQTYTTTSCKASGIIDPRVRLLHRLVSVAFFGRLESSGNVTQQDLNILYSWKKENWYICPARALATYFLQFHGRYPAQAIAGGHFITTLARGLGVLNPDVERTMTIVGRVSPLTVRTFQNIGIVTQQGNTYILLSRSGNPWMPGGFQEEQDQQQHPPPPPNPPPPQPTHFSPDADYFDINTISFTPQHTPNQTPPYHPPQSWFDNVTSQLEYIHLSQDRLEAGQQRLETGQQRLYERQNQIQDFQSSMMSWFQGIFPDHPYPPPPPQ